ncbi:methionine biosynthesis protein MetW [Zymomonas sp.]|uniref:methionine biosynthesis protein MetW n=1 Tax=Zymomonas sp. TaxID=2068624 RepID=UPI0025F77AC5|nr:methionine biosynthesis protein MetW [Zymomonas sp.]MCA1955723.1 methionine biosynthesis protein MetW [Zymomonas sp.]
MSLKDSQILEDPSVKLSLSMQPERPDFAIISNHIIPESRVLDIGCGDGALIASLKKSKNIDARGIEINPTNVGHAVSRGLSVIQGDADTDLVNYPDQAFDFVILSQTLQTTRAPHQVLNQLLRIGRYAFVSFPNFAYWKVRLALMLKGRMPVTPNLPISWYETDNIHMLTIEDFYDFTAQHHYQVKESWFFSHNKQISATAANWRAESALFLLYR